MGNRAVLTTRAKGTSCYLHWNGGRDSVEAFLKYCELKGYRSPDTDCYGWARLVQVIGNFFGGTLSVGIDTYDRLDTDNWDNGVYIIEGWNIVGREYFDGEEQYNHDLDGMLKAIDEAMPEKERLGVYLDAAEVSIKDVKIGDEVFMRDIDGNFKTYHIVGFGTGMVNGRDCTNVPYVDKYCNGGKYDGNINNYVPGETCRIKQ